MRKCLRLTGLLRVEVVEGGKKHVKELFLLTEEFFPYIQPSEELILDRMNSGSVSYFVALFEGKVVGFVDVEFNDSSVFDELHKPVVVEKGVQAKILGLAVKKDFQKKGIGSLLLKKALSFSKEKQASSVVMLVKESNKIAQKLYERFGFSKKGVLQRELDGERVLLFSKSFSN
ncbi:GNAT family N-acetyltransferase [Candidatus Micrarchaeota archaeon]|nr:GNAT family N-acetyltransferase [Candidatus Micrarchaeota archaeon]